MVLLEYDKAEGQKGKRMTVLSGCLSLPASQAGKYLLFSSFYPYACEMLKKTGGCHQCLVQILLCQALF